MIKFLVGNSEEFEDHVLVMANNDQEAIDKYINFLPPSDNFIEHLHERTINMSFSEKFHFDEKSEGQKTLPKKEVQQRIHNYFKEKPEYIEIYNSHWDDDQNSINHQMSQFPDEMINWIWKKELLSGEWMHLQAINLDELKEI